MKRTASGVQKPVLRRTSTRVYKPPSTNGAMRQRRISGPVYQKLRFRVTSESQVNISPADLLSSCGVVAFSSGSAYRIFEAIRVQYAKIYGAPPAAGDSNTIKLEFLGGENRGANDLLINTSNNPNVCPMIYGKPSRYATASDWANAGVTSSFITLLAPVNSILEVGVWVNRYEDTNSCSVQTGSFTAGQFRYIAPDTQLQMIA